VLSWLSRGKDMADCSMGDCAGPYPSCDDGVDKDVTSAFRPFSSGVLQKRKVDLIGGTL